MQKTSIAILLLSCTLSLVSSPAAQAQTKRAGNYIGCMTEDALNRYSTALSNRDQRLSSSMLMRECTLVGGKEYSILDRGFVTSQIRVYQNGGYLDVWVPSEAIQ